MIYFFPVHIACTDYSGTLLNGHPSTAETTEPTKAKVLTTLIDQSRASAFPGPCPNLNPNPNP